MIADAVQFAIAEANRKVANDFARGMRGMAQQGAGMQEQMNGMQFNQPPNFPRG